MHHKGLAALHQRPAARLVERQPGIKGDGVAARLTQLRKGALGRVRLAGDGAVEHAYLIRADNPAVGLVGGQRLRFGHGQARHQGVGGFACARRFVNVWRSGNKRQAEFAQQRLTKRRG